VSPVALQQIGAVAARCRHLHQHLVCPGRKHLAGLHPDPGVRAEDHGEGGPVVSTVFFHFTVRSSKLRNGQYQRAPENRRRIHAEAIRHSSTYSCTFGNSSNFQILEILVSRHGLMV
ncbi:hypothetical protein, partial [Melaminivora alkalimesophila]|uniref:hypothetical protein n=1 Tax=Melaminivora alkalimesophila TaxID=1165852 RepID=UPI001300C3A8